MYSRSRLQFDSILVDYLHKRKFPVIGPLASWLLRGATVATLVGVYQFNTNDIGAYPRYPPRAGPQPPSLPPHRKPACRNLRQRMEPPPPSLTTAPRP